MKNEIIKFCQVAIGMLDRTPDFGTDFVYLKMDFCKLYQNGLIFSTRFGADFFEEVLFRILNNAPITPSSGEKLGQYDTNFNIWLKLL